VPTVFDNPKSRIFSVRQLEFTTMLLGFKSFGKSIMLIMFLLIKIGKISNFYLVNDSSQMEMFNPTNHLIKEIRHPLVIQIHFNYLLRRER